MITIQKNTKTTKNGNKRRKKKERKRIAGPKEGKLNAKLGYR
jgi:hypothetical protein